MADAARGVNREPFGPRPALTGMEARTATVEVTAGNFKDIVTMGIVLLDFWAAWCGPCRAMASAYEQAAQRLGTKVRLGKLDTESAPEVAAQFGIRSIPTLIAFRGGKEVAQCNQPTRPPTLPVDP